MVGRTIDALGVARIGLVGLSLGGYSWPGPWRLSLVWRPSPSSAVFRLDWEELPPPVRGIMVRRTGGADAAREFAQQVGPNPRRRNPVS